MVTARRTILGAAFGAAAAMIAQAIGRPSGAAANTGDNVVLGQLNTANADTTVHKTTGGGAAIHGLNDSDGNGVIGESSSGNGVQGSSQTGPGVVAHSINSWGLAATSSTSTGAEISSTSGIGANITSSSGHAVDAISTSSTGVRAVSADSTPSTFAATSHKTGAFAIAGNTGVPGAVDGIAANTDETGVYGFANVSSHSTGVWGDTWDGVGVLGSGSIGVYGLGHYGVYAKADGGSGSAALVTSGKIVFGGRQGVSSVVSGHSYRDVTVSGMASSSLVIATLRSNRSGFYVQAVVSYAGKFRLYLNKTAPGTTYFSYLVLG
jgi:hypothetical protein